MLTFGLLAFLAMALFDAWFSARRIPQLGIEAEYNPFIRWLSHQFSIKTGMYVGVLLPTAIVMMVGFRFPCVLVYLLGLRTTLFSFQLKVLNKT